MYFASDRLICEVAAMSPLKFLMFFNKNGKTWFWVVAFCSLYLIQPQLVLSHSPGEKKHDLENLTPKPEGMIQFDKDSKAGDEYLKEKSEKDVPFRTMGAHDMMGHDMGKSKLAPGKALLARGKAIYMHMCVFCHGKDGNGGGPAMSFLYPWPRDFRSGIFKFRSTPTGTLPRDEDIYRTIIRGIPGTSMPNWSAALSPQDTWALVNMIKSFSPRFKTQEPGKALDATESPPASPESIARGQDLFLKHKCTNCHGKSGKGDGKLAESLMDAWKHAVFVHDITNPSYLKAGHDAKSIFRTLSTGLDGTPMESYAHLPEQDRWDLTNFIRSRFTNEPSNAAFETDVYSKKVDFELDTTVDSPAWEGVQSTDIVLRPLSARRGAVEMINFSSINNGEQLAVRLRWKDPTPDEDQTLGDQYLDQSAMQFALGSVTLHTHGHNEPFWGMGNRGKPVNIWHWRSGLEKALEKAEDEEYHGDVDMDALIFGGQYSSPAAALNRPKETAVTELNAEGFGTITPQPSDNQHVIGSGQWKDGEWTVVFLRDLIPLGKWDINLTRTDPILVAFAVWDGLKEDRNGRKVVSVWQRLNILSK
jgi:cytochrome c